jgi:hypothetical protein
MSCHYKNGDSYIFFHIKYSDPFPQNWVVRYSASGRQATGNGKGMCVCVCALKDI